MKKEPIYSYCSVVGSVSKSVNHGKMLNQHRNDVIVMDSLRAESNCVYKVYLTVADKDKAGQSIKLVNIPYNLGQLIKKAKENPREFMEETVKNLIPLIGPSIDKDFSKGDFAVLLASIGYFLYKERVIELDKQEVELIYSLYTRFKYAPIEESDLIAYVIKSGCLASEEKAVKAIESLRNKQCISIENGKIALIEKVVITEK